TFFVVLRNPVNASIARSTATGTIIDDDGAPAVSIGDAALEEGDSGLSDMVFPVARSSTSSQTVTINFQTVDGSAISTATNAEYVVTSGALSIPAGAIFGQIRVPVVGDTFFEPNETFQLRLTGAAGGSLARSAATGTIIDDDGLRISIGDTVVQESNPGAGA